MSDPGRPLGATDEITATHPTSPAYRESASLWCWDDASRFAFPRIGVEAVGQTWDTSFMTAVCVALPGERLLLATEDYPPFPVADVQGRPRVLGAGPLRFQCVEPFAHWSVDFDGEVVARSVEGHLAGGAARIRVTEADRRDVVALRLHVEAHMLAPPWFQGTHDPEGHHVIGEQRHEQLCAVTGRIETDGIDTSFTGGGLRVHRTGGARNDYGEFHGHNWQSARFPSGRAFGFIHYRPGPDGTTRYREAWVLDDGEVLAARVEGTAWMADTRPSGTDVSCTLHTPKGSIHIGAETVFSSIRPPRPTTEGTTFPTLQSGIARYRWGREEALGMVERSARLPSL